MAEWRCSTSMVAKERIGVMLVDRLAESPNPQFSRPGWTDLTGRWRVRFDVEDAGLRERWFTSSEQFDRVITVPYPPESTLSGIAERGFHPVVWYAREFADTRTSQNERLRLCFGAVDYEAIVWVDGTRIGEHCGGQTPFTIDVTDALLPDREQHIVVVRAADDPHDAEQPRGKQDWLEEPHQIWYHRTSGIWQPVWSEVTPPIAIERVRWRFDRARWLIDYEVELSGKPPAGAQLTIALEIAGEPIAELTVTAAGRLIAGQMGLGHGARIMHPEGLLWSPAHPNLIGATLTLTSGAGRDVVESYLGLRTLELGERGVRINGRPHFLRFVLNQGYWPESHLTAPSPAALRREVELILELGFNGCRIHQKIEDPRFLYWADRLGLLLWGESAGAFTYSELAIDRHAAEWRDAVLRDRNHPSIIAWAPFNESWGVNEIGRSPEQQAAVHAIYHRTHQLDGTRPVIGNDGWDYVAGDIFTIHDYGWDAEQLRARYRDRAALATTLTTHFPGQRELLIGDLDISRLPVMVTEYGGVSYAPGASEEWYGYGQVRTDEEFLETYRRLTAALASSELLSGFCYTQLTDTLQETNGLLREDRTPKIDIARIAAATRGVGQS